MFENLGPNYWWELAIKEEKARKEEEYIRQRVRDEVELLRSSHDRHDGKSARGFEQTL